MSLPISLIYHKYGSDITGTSVPANPEDYYVGPNVKIDRNAYIEPDVVLGPNVKIGKNAVIYTGSVIRNCIIGDDFTCGENTVIGYESAIDTVQMNGTGFNYLVERGQRVKAGDKLLSFSKKAIKDAGKLDTVVCVVLGGN